MCSEGRDLGDMFASWEKDVTNGLRISYSSEPDQGWHTPRRAVSHDRGRWYGNCIHESPTRWSERGCSVQIHEQLVNQGYQFEAGPTVQSAQGRSQRDVGRSKNSLWVDVRGHTTADGAHNADA